MQFIGQGNTRMRLHPGILAPPARLELTTSRLGGVRSIQVSYGGMLIYSNQIIWKCQENTAQFLLHAEYTIKYIFERSVPYA